MKAGESRLGEQKPRPPSTSAATDRGSFDAAWGELVESARDDAAPPPPSAASTDDAPETKVWDDQARAAGLPAPARAADRDGEGPHIAESSSTDRPTATLDDEGAQPDERVQGSDPDATMDAMMSGSWAMATRDVATAMMPPKAAPARDLRESEAEMAALMGTDAVASESNTALPTVSKPAESPRAPSRTPTEAASTRTPTEAASTRAHADERAAATRAHEPRSSEPRARRPTPEPAARPVVVRPAVDDDEPERPRVAVPAQRRVVAPEPRRITARTAALELGTKPRRSSLAWAVVAGVAIAGTAWWVSRDDTPQPTTVAAARGKDDTPKAAVVDTPELRSHAQERRGDTTPAPQPVVTPPSQPSVPTPSPTPASTTKTPAPPVADAPAPTPAKSRSNNPREAPPGTPPEIAATFARLPVSPADLPPVGGVGGTGIHIDRIEMGATYDKDGCGSVANAFSVASLEEINVCMRVVHPRQDEVMSIVWQKKDGSTARRGKIAVKPLHAYRTRAYLRLRAEYVGEWSVRIMSEDGVELASHAFSIRP
ncbi:MAG: DUF2914 domain-containing protein [Nannocystaceae bacterium]|nr:DUF2914 domain-containing protein [Nannocystaceae bacterium]